MIKTLSVNTISIETIELKMISEIDNNGVTDSRDVLFATKRRIVDITL